MNNPRFVLAILLGAGILFGRQYLPADWKRGWENMLLGEAAKLGLGPEEAGPGTELSAGRLLGVRPLNLPGDAERLLARPGLERALFPVTASNSEKKWQQQEEGPRFPEGLRLEAVYREGEVKVAIISGLLVQEGDYVRGAKVIQIVDGYIQGDLKNLARVTFELDNRQQDLVIGRKSGEVVETVPKSSAEVSEPTQPRPSRAAPGMLQQLKQGQNLLQNPLQLLEGSQQ